MTVTFVTKESARMRIKVQPAVIQSYRADGRAIYSQSPLYAEFDHGVCIVDEETENGKLIVEALRKSKDAGKRFVEVKPGDSSTSEKKHIVKFSASALSGMNKTELLDLCKTYSLAGVLDGDTKAEIIQSITDFYKTL